MRRDASACAAARARLRRSPARARRRRASAAAAASRLLSRDGDLQRPADDRLQLRELPAHGAQVGAERRQAAADEIDEHLEILDARHALGQQIALDALDRGGELPVLIDDRVEPAAETALVLAQGARDGRLDARRQDRRELARRAPQLVDVALRARQQRAQVGACGLVGAKVPLAQLADAAQGRLARVPQWILLRVFGVHAPPRDGAKRRSSA